MDDSAHASREALEKGLALLSPPPRDQGTVALVVVRPQAGERLVPARCRLSPEKGVEGDRWLHKDPPVAEAQVSVMRASVARLIAGEQPLELFGDNLLVEIDLSPSNLPVGSRVQVGSALCLVTAKPHTGCKKFAERFGQASRDFVSDERLLEHRLRGIYFRVVEEGEVGPGDTVTVLSRGG